MKELYIFCEGPTEQGFCRQVLQPVVFPNHDGKIHTIKVSQGRKRGVVHRGGITNYAPVRNDILNQLNANRRPNVVFTTMIDLYALPNDFPGRGKLQKNPSMPVEYVNSLEKAFTEDIGDRRFFAHIQLHEYETLIFADLEKLGLFYDGIEKEIATLQKAVDEFPTIEHINEEYETCPSRRIYRQIPPFEKDKASYGPGIADAIGIETIREKCPHFDLWIAKLESLWSDA